MNYSVEVKSLFIWLLRSSLRQLEGDISIVLENKALYLVV